MIYVTGDTHGEFSRFCDAAFPLESTLGATDYVLVCGDFGFVFYPEGTAKAARQKEELDLLSQKPYTILFIDGNHENFHTLNAFPTKMWNGGRIHLLRPNILHLMRGQVYTIDGKTFFTMGGAYSRDRFMRVKNQSYWEEELPDNSEYREATANLKEVQNRVDYIFTHTAPRQIILQYLRKMPDPHDAELTGFFDWLMENVQFSHWYFGHWHTDLAIGKRFHAMYMDTEPLASLPLSKTNA